MPSRNSVSVLRDAILSQCVDIEPLLEACFALPYAWWATSELQSFESFQINKLHACLATNVRTRRIAAKRIADAARAAHVKVLQFMPSLLHVAAHADAHDAAAKLIARGLANVDEGMPYTHITPLHVACARGAARVVEVLLAAGANTAVCDVGGYTPLHAAAASGSAACVTALCRHDASVVNVHTRYGRGGTALHLAACAGSVECVDALITHGADMHALDTRGHSALVVAVTRGHDQVVHCLLAHEALCEHDATPPSRDVWDLRALFGARGDDGVALAVRAIVNERTAVLRILLSHGVSANAVDSLGIPLLAYAVLTRNEESVGTLLLHGANVQAACPPASDTDAESGPLSTIDDFVSAIREEEDAVSEDASSEHASSEDMHSVSYTDEDASSEDMHSNESARKKTIVLDAPLNVPRPFVERNSFSLCDDGEDEDEDEDEGDYYNELELTGVMSDDEYDDDCVSITEYDVDSVPDDMSDAPCPDKSSYATVLCTGILWCVKGKTIAQVAELTNNRVVYDMLATNNAERE